jgi:hypothetical protein
MRNRVRLALIGIVFAAACGSDSTAPATRRLQLVSVDGHALPAAIYNVNGDAGSIVGGYVDGVPGDSQCGFRLSLHRQGTGGTGTSDAVGGATCIWTGSGNASATIDLGNNPPWGSHSYTFNP